MEQVTQSCRHNPNYIHNLDILGSYIKRSCQGKISTKAECKSIGHFWNIKKFMTFNSLLHGNDNINPWQINHIIKYRLCWHRCPIRLKVYGILLHSALECWILMGDCKSWLIVSHPAIFQPRQYLSVRLCICSWWRSRLATFNEYMFKFLPKRLESPSNPGHKVNSLAWLFACLLCNLGNIWGYCGGLSTEQTFLHWSG